MASIKCVVPQARMKAPNSQTMVRNGTSLLRRTKKPRMQEMAKYADQTPRSERMCSQPSPGVHEPQSQRLGKSDVSKSLVKKSTVHPLRGRLSERCNAPRRAYSYEATVDPRRPSARTQTNSSQRPVLSSYTGRRRDIVFWLCERGQHVGSLTMRRQDGLKNLPTFLLFLLSQRRELGDDCLVAICTWQQGCE